MISLLIRCGANVNMVDRGFQTPLHVAAKIGRVNNVEELLHAGAKPDLKDNSGQSPLHLAAAKDTTGAISLVMSFCQTKSCSSLNTIHK